MKKEQRPNNEAQQQDTTKVSDKIAQNPNPRANENIRERQKEPGTESADMEDEVGTEITDGEDA
jgi:hypothetical protein